MREIDQDLKRYVEQTAEFTRTFPHRGHYASTFDLIAQKGELANPEPFTPEEQELLLEIFDSIKQTPRQQECYYNAQRLMLFGRPKELRYGEGYIARRGLPIALEHGWNLLASGKAVDLTIRERDEKNTCKPVKLLERAIRNQANAYYGIVFPREEIQASWIRNQQSLMLMMDPVVQAKIEEGKLL